MSDHADADADDSEGHDSDYATERETAPQSDYGTGDVALGFVVALVGMAVVFGVPLLLA